MYSDIQQEVINSTKSLVARYPDYPVIVTGHSLGGALCSLFALDWISAGQKIKHFYTFEQPRVFNPKLAKEFYKIMPHAIRVVHHYDIVARLPFRDLLFLHYLHHPTEVWYYNKYVSNYNISYTECRSQGLGFFGEDPHCSVSTDWRLLNFWDHEHQNLGYFYNCSLGIGFD